MPLPPIPQALKNRELEDFLGKTKSTVDALVVGSGSDHGGLTGLGDDDHPHYYNTSRLNSWFASQTVTATLDDLSVIDSAGTAPITLITYTSGLPTLINFTNSSGFTNNSKTITYTSGLPTTISHVFDYDGQTWTVTTTINYTSGLPVQKLVSVVKA